MASQTETKRIPFSTISQALEQGIAGADPARAVGLLGLHRVRAAKTSPFKVQKYNFETKQPPAKAGGFRRPGRGLKVRKERPRLQKPLDLTDVPLVGGH